MNGLKKYKGIIFNLVFTLYACFLHIPLARSMEPVLNQNQPWISMAFVLFPLSILEGIYLPCKLRSLFYKSDSTIPTEALALWFMPALIFRTIIGIAVATLIFHLITPEFLHQSRLTPVGTAMALIVLLKELILFFLCQSILVRNSTMRCQVKLEWVGDILQLIYSCAVFTMITRPGVFFTVHVSHVLLPLMFICFLVFLQSLRLGFFVEEHLFAETKWDIVWIIGSLVAAAAAATWAIA
jgi:hypothetical protein